MQSSTSGHPRRDARRWGIASLAMAAAGLAAGSAAAGGNCPADITGDGQVDGADLSVLLGGWGLPGVSDITGDGVTNGTDLGVLLGSWGLCPENPIEIAVNAGAAALSFTEGGSVGVAFTIEVEGVGDAAVVLEVSQLSVPAGLSIVNDVPEGGFIVLSDGVFVFNALVSGASAGTFAIETEVSPSEGEPASNTLPVEVLPLAGIPELSPLSVEPAAVNPETPTIVTFSVALSGTSVPPVEFTLARAQPDGTPIAFPATLRDDGVAPDLSAGDGVYTGQISVNAGAGEDSRFYKAFESAPLAGGLLETPLYELNVTPYPVGPAASDPGSVVEGPGGTPVYSNEIIIYFAPGTSDARIAEIVDSIDGTIVGSVPATGAYQVSFPGNGTFAGVQAVIAQMKTVVDVDIVEPLFPITTAEFVPNDPLWPTQIGVATIRATEAWTVANGEVVIAIVDTGVESTHPDFQLATGGSKVLVLPGSDVLDGDDDPGDADGHGTRMAGIAGAIGNNGLGIAGVAWRSPILAVRAFGEGASDVTLAQGIVFAAANGARVISVSGGLEAPTIVLEDAIAYARDRGCLIVASAGNQVDGANVTTYPCSFAGVFCVGAVDDEGQPLAGANISLSIDLVAPGENVPTTSADGGYTTSSGSSPAAAMVAGAAAVAWSIDPTLSAATIEARLIAGAAPLPPSLLDPATGRLDVFESTFDGSFELPGLETWTTEGTVSVLESLGRLVPTDRLRMAYVSTGPAGAGVAASLRKDFKIQPGVTMFAITFDYDFITEEWPEYVGSEFNDSLRIVLVEPDGAEVLLAVETVNDSVFFPVEGIDFPGGDDTVGHTGWKTVTAVVPITKGPGSYTIRIEDAGDDVFDSVALVDRIRLVGDPQALYCGAPQAGDCCEAHPTPFCADSACCNTVCLVDPTCCQTAWDAGCATLASELCDSCTPVQEICDNGVDDDGDGLIDCDDPDCAAFPGCTKSGFCGDPQSGDCCEENGTPFCSDATCCETVCAADAFCCASAWDSICATAAASLCGGLCGGGAQEICDNGVDDDGDGLVDCDDPECAADPNCPACPDGLSDCQGQCVDLSTDPMNCGECGVVCDDGNPCTVDVCVFGVCVHTPIDADGDGYSPFPCGGDCDDSNPDVNPDAKEVCNNGIDDDCDSLVDCDDPDCAGDSGCGGGSGAFADLCSNAPLVQGGFLPFDTLGATGSGTVGGVAIQKDVWAKYVPDCTGLLTVSNCPAYGESVPPDWDSVIAVWAGTSCGSLQLVAVSDNFCGVQSAVVAPVAAGSTYFIQVGGKGAVNAGIGTIYVACGDCGGCAEGALLEQEPCGVRLNDACNMQGTPVTQPIEPGQSFCGEIWASGNARDTDFYSFTLDAPAIIEWTVSAGLPLFTQIFEAACPFGDAIAIGDFLVCPGSLTVTLPPGTYWAFVGTFSFEGLPCNSPIERRYTVSLAVTELVELCDNGTDDDGDGLIDCDDPDCAQFPGCSKSGGCGDPNSGDCCEGNGTPFCSDATCCETVCAADPFCCNTEWDQLCAQSAVVLCGGLCGGGTQELCDNGIDDDGDQLVDCEDPDCVGSPACCAGDFATFEMGDLMLAGNQIESLSFNASGSPSEVSITFDYVTNAAGSWASDLVLVIDDGVNPPVYWGGFNTSFNGVVNGGAWPFSGSQSAGSGFYAATVAVPVGSLLLNGSFTIGIGNGWTTSPVVEYNGIKVTLNGICGGSAQELCDNGIDDDGDQLVDCDDPDCAAFPGCTKSGLCGDPQSGDCCEDNGTPFCSDATCCETVCAADPFCCETEWDQICAQAAATLCGGLCGGGAQEICDNGLDDDSDGLIDCQDPDCFEFAGCSPQDWATVLEFEPDPTVVTDPEARAAIIATGLPWRVRDNRTLIEMLLVPAGTFVMGCSPSLQSGCGSDESPVHQVILTRPFYLGRYEVTQAEWTALMGTNPSAFQGQPDSPQRPVENISWDRMTQFKAASGLRLPTEAEWEYACRAGTQTAYHNSSSDSALLNEVAWFSGNNSPGGTKAVGQKLPNAWGFHDMHGNAYEWCEDWYSETYYAASPTVDPTGPASGAQKVMRGGFFDAPAAFCRASTRNRLLAGGLASFYNGFRAARTPSSGRETCGDGVDDDGDGLIDCDDPDCFAEPGCCPDGQAACGGACVDLATDPANCGECGVVCDDGDLCTVDTCVDGVCVHTAINCDDGDPCTVDTCVDGVCVHTPIDADGDGYATTTCGGGDCDDSNPDVNPGAAEICDNGLDDDCDGLIDCDDPDCVGRSGCVVGDWATVLEPLPDPSVVTDLGLLASIVSTGLPWRVLDTETGIEMLLVPPGTYARGCSPVTGGECDANELPVHQVTITRPFYLSRFEVTQGQWLSVMGSNPSFWGPEQNGPDSVKEMLPVEQVSWAMVQEFEASTGLRLPTEAEWEYACRAGTTTAFNGGSDDLVSAVALGWFDGGDAANGLNDRTHAVGRKSPNRLGLYDMHGNVAEWVEDWMAPYSGHSGQTDPTGPLTGTQRVVRGGHYDASANLGRSSSRADASPTSADRRLGLRVARSVSG